MLSRYDMFQSNLFAKGCFKDTYRVSNSPSPPHRIVRGPDSFEADSYISSKLRVSIETLGAHCAEANVRSRDISAPNETFVLSECMLKICVLAQVIKSILLEEELKNVPHASEAPH